MTQPGPTRAVFLGSGAFAVPVLEAVAAHAALALIAVVSTPDRPAGRGHRPRPVPVALLARERDWPLLQPARLREPAVIDQLLGLRAGLFVLADYGRIVPPALVDAPSHGALNVHPSLLPRHRGASPVAATILAGDEESGVTIIRMDAGVDTGPIVARERTAVRPDDTAPQLEARLAVLGAALLSRIIDPWLAGAISPRPQPQDGATVTRVLGREDGRLEWSRDAAALERQVRALQPWPGSFTGSAVGRLTVWRTVVAPSMLREEADGAVAAQPGTVVAAGRGIAVVCGQGVLELMEVQRAGRSRVSGRDLRNGHPDLVGSHLG